MIRIIITGVAGKMGGSILRSALEDRAIQVVGATEAKGHPAVGKTLDLFAAGGDSAVVVADSLADVIEGCDVVIDFTGPEASLHHFRVCAGNKKAIVMGTTGFGEEALREINDTKGANAVVSPNMSMGMNLMFDVVERVARVLLRDDYDVEIVEMHHRWKKDAPSGTAMKIKDVIERAVPEKTWKEIFGRKGIPGERTGDEIAVMAIRGGDVVGEHTAMFAGIGERIEVTHRAFSRDNFARGALVAAKWIAGRQKRGVYSMKDVLGL